MERILDFDIRGIKHPAYTANYFGVVTYVNEAFISLVTCIDPTNIQKWEDKEALGVPAALEPVENSIRRDISDLYKKHHDCAVRREIYQRSGSAAPADPEDEDDQYLIGKHVVEVILDHFDFGENAAPHNRAGTYLCNLFGAKVLRRVLFGDAAEPLPPNQTQTERPTGGCLHVCRTKDAPWPPEGLGGVDEEEIRRALDKAAREDERAESGKNREYAPDNRITRAIALWLRYCSSQCSYRQDCISLLAGLISQREASGSTHLN